MQSSFKDGEGFASDYATGLGKGLTDNDRNIRGDVRRLLCMHLLDTLTDNLSCTSNKTTFGLEH